MSGTEDPNGVYTPGELARVDEDARYEGVHGVLGPTGRRMPASTRRATTPDHSAP